MSFLDKLQFWKHKDDFSLDDDKQSYEQYSQDPQQEWGNQQDPSLPPQDFSSSQQSFDDMHESKYALPQDPYTQNSQNQSFNEYPQQEQSNFRTIQPGEEPSEAEYGKQLARKYINQREAQESNQQEYPQTQSSDLLNLKIDVLRSELTIANQRLQKIEHLLEAQAKSKHY